MAAIPRGYCTVEDVLGRLPSMTAQQIDLCAGQIAAAEDAVDQVVGRTWLQTISSELHAGASRVLLYNTPVQQVIGVQYWAGSAWSTLDAVYYTVDDLARGLVRLYASWTGEIRVDYVVGPPPALVSEATIRAAVAWLKPYGAAIGQDMDPLAVQSYGVAGALTVQFRDPYPASAGLPQESVALLRTLRGLVFA